jgi:hypothetical protein
MNSIFSLKDLKNVWKSTLTPHFMLVIVLIVILVSILLATLPSYFSYIQDRKGILIADKLLSILPSADLSWIIFPIVQLSLLIGIAHLLHYPEVLITGIGAYILLMLLRMLTIYLLPLEPPQGLVLLNDPVNEALFYGHRVVTKDLFFSGHVSTICILFLTAQNKKLKKLFFSLILVLATMILVQHVHYSIDVLAAPLFTWICYKTSVILFNKAV